MVYICSAYCDFDRYSEVVNNYVQFFPKAFIQKLNAFKFKADSYRYLVGKILLLKGIRQLGYTDLTLSDVCFSKYNKPYLTNGLNFNITHSENIVLCAISRDCQVGIDLEKINSIRTTGFSHCFTMRERAYIFSSDCSLRSFYELWTRKEAIAKADGRGLYISLLDFEVISDIVFLESREWHLIKLSISAEYCCHLATDVNTRGNYSIYELTI